MSLIHPDKITDTEYRFDSFSNGKVLLNKKKGKLPAMGWNSWNAFGSGNTESLTKAMADKIIELGLDKLGYKFLVLDDGCYKAERINGKLSNEEVKFPSGFKALSDYIHSKGLKFGMYNDIGTNLCAGAAVGTCGHEKTDAQSYIDWGVDFLKIDNCYYLWDNATFSNPENAKYVYCPKIKGLKITKNNTIPENKKCVIPDTDTFENLSSSALIPFGNGVKYQNDFYENIGTFDGTNTGTSPVGELSGELQCKINAPCDATYEIIIEYATDTKVVVGQWLQLAVNNNIVYDDLLPPSPNPNEFIMSKPISIELKKGENLIRIMNHRRQENTLCSYATMLESLNEADPNHDILLSICEWGKTQPQHWGYKVGDSWRILNDITFRVGSDGDAGFGEWNNPGTQSITSQYNKAVIMDEFSGLDKGWNDPDMMVIGMKDITLTMCRTHFAMWCMMNSPLMLGFDLRRLQKGDELYEIITNEDLIALNQDALGIQAKRIATSFPCKDASKEYITDNNRFDLLAKPLMDGSVAISVFNLSDKERTKDFEIDINYIKDKLASKTPEKFTKAQNFEVKDLWTKEILTTTGKITLPPIEPCGNVVLKICPK